MARRHYVPLADVALRLLLILLLLIGAPSVSLAWGEAGHSTVAEIAAHYLSETAKAEVRELLGPGEHEMAAAASWADEVRDSDRPETYNWHQVEMPPDGMRYDRVRDCANDDCIVEKLKAFAQMVGDRQLAKAARAEALKFLIHFVGDIHVPLHALAPLSRGKGTWVRIGGTTEKLHCLWDYAWCDSRF